MKKQATQQCAIISRIMENIKIKTQSNKPSELYKTTFDPPFSTLNGMMDNANSIFVIRPYLGSPIHQV